MKEGVICGSFHDRVLKLIQMFVPYKMLITELIAYERCIRFAFSARSVPLTLFYEFPNEELICFDSTSRMSIDDKVSSKDQKCELYYFCLVCQRNYYFSHTFRFRI